MSIEITYPTLDLLPSFHACLDRVAREKVYLEMTEAPPLEKVVAFQTSHIQNNGAVYYAVDKGKVVGWCDVFPEDNPRQKHRGSLGMGLLPEHRRQGLGTKLVTAVLDHCQRMGLEKIELHVYTTNLPAIALYKKLGFEQEGLIRKYRKVDDQYFDCMAMAKFLS